MQQSARQGAVVLGVVIITAIVFSVTAFAALTVANSRASVARILGASRLRAVYAAEAGLVWAMQQLYDDSPAFSSAAGTIDLPWDVNGDGAVSPGEGVDVEIAACGVPPCFDRELKATVTYQ